MLLITKILAVIILLICLGFIAYWAIAIIKGDCVLKVMKSKRTPFHVESMDMKSVTLLHATDQERRQAARHHHGCLCPRVPAF